MRGGHAVRIEKDPTPPLRLLALAAPLALAPGDPPSRESRPLNIDLLILGDFGLRPMAATAGEDLYELVHGRYEHRSILLTSNRAPTEWPSERRASEVFGNELLASAALDRLTRHAHMTCITGQSYRQRQRPKEATA